MPLRNIAGSGGMSGFTTWRLRDTGAGGDEITASGSRVSTALQPA
jgi:hypothetical protein